MISTQAKIGGNCSIADTAIIHDNVILSEGCSVEHYCELGHPAPGEFRGKPLVLGSNSLVRSHTVLYEGSIFGDDLRVGHHSLVREGVVAGKNLQVGSFNTLEGDLKIGDWCRFHSNVHVGRNAEIGDLVWLFPFAMLANNPLPPSELIDGVTIGPAAVIGTTSVLLPGACIGRGAFIAANSCVGGNIVAASHVSGPEGKVKGTINELIHFESGTRHPWMNHFSHSYPEQAQKRIAELYQLIKGDIAILRSQLKKQRAKHSAISNEFS